MVLKVTLQKQSSKQLLHKFSSEAFFKIAVLKNFATGKHLCWSPRPKGRQLYEKENSRQVFCCDTGKFLRAAFSLEHLRWLFLSVNESCWIMGVCQQSFLNQKAQCGKVFTKNFCRSGQSMFFTYYRQKPFQHIFVN